MGDDEKSLRGKEGERCWEMRARREDMIGILVRARIMSGIMNERITKLENGLNLNVIHTAIKS